jgi:hypothetical protein
MYTYYFPSKNPIPSKESALVVFGITPQPLHKPTHTASKYKTFFLKIFENPLRLLKSRGKGLNLGIPPPQ